MIENKENDFWDKHGPNLVEALILAGIVGVFILGWDFKDQLAKVQTSFAAIQETIRHNSEKVRQNESQIGQIRENNVTRIEMALAIGRIEKSVERIEDKLEKEYRKNGDSRIR